MPRTVAGKKVLKLLNSMSREWSTSRAEDDEIDENNLKMVDAIEEEMLKLAKDDVILSSNGSEGTNSEVIYGEKEECTSN
jgi:hypothetical protein